MNFIERLKAGDTSATFAYVRAVAIGILMGFLAGLYIASI